MATGSAGHADRADGLVASPRGLAALSGMCGEDLDVWPRRLPGPLGDPTAHPFDARRPVLGQAWGDEPSLDDAERLAVEVLSHGSGYAWWGDRRLTADAVTRRGSAFLGPARQLLAAPAARWWADGIARDRQVVLGRPDVPPDLTARVSDQFQMLGPPWFGRVPQALTTSRRLGDRLPAVGLCDPEIALLTGDGPAGCWAVRVAADARVFEVHGVEEWRELLARYPRRVATTDDLRIWSVTTREAVVPDWEAFAQDWDGLHVSMLGVLTAQGVPVVVDDLEGVLEDVDTDLTAWFRPCLDEPTLAATLREDELPRFLPWP